MKSMALTLSLLSAVLLSCEEGGLAEDPHVSDTIDLPEIGLIKDYGPIAADGCGWVIGIDTTDYTPASIPDFYLVDSLYILSAFELLEDTFICFGNHPYSKIQILHLPETELVTIYWDQTQCSDPWGQPADKWQTVEAIAAYMVEEGVRPYSIRFDVESNLPVSCDACHCGTGIRMNVGIEETELEKALTLGFRIADTTRACYESDPLESIPWLRELKMNFEVNEDPAGNRIVQYAYLGECVFWIDDCYHCADKLIQVHNYSGEVICEFGGIDGRNTCPDFLKEASGEVILWENID